MLSKQQILDDFIQAFKDKDEVRKLTLASIKAEILVYEKKKSGNEIDSDKLLDILNSMAKKHKESITAYEEGDREELAQKEREELAIIESYLPEQMSEDKIKEVIEQVITKNSFTQADFGRAMGAVMVELKGKADGTLVSKILKEVLK